MSNTLFSCFSLLRSGRNLGARPITTAKSSSRTLTTYPFASASSPKPKPTRIMIVRREKPRNLPTETMILPPTLAPSLEESPVALERERTRNPKVGVRRDEEEVDAVPPDDVKNQRQPIGADESIFGRIAELTMKKRERLARKRILIERDVEKWKERAGGRESNATEKKVEHKMKNTVHRYYPFSHPWESHKQSDDENGEGHM